MEENDDRVGPAEVVELDAHRRSVGERRAPFGSPRRSEAEMMEAMDTTTRNLHVVATVALKMVFLMRRDLGLSDLRR
jgi:hypothetical protein